MTRVITLDEINEGLDAIVAEHGANYIYQPPYDGETCYYVHSKYGPDGPSHQCGCIVGHLMVRLGFSLEKLLEVEQDSAGSVSFQAALGFEYEVGGATLLSETQSQQDCGTPWGAAVALGREALEDAQAPETDDEPPALDGGQ